MEGNTSRSNINQSEMKLEVLTPVNEKNVVFWDVTPCGTCKNRRFVYFFAACFGCQLLLTLFLVRRFVTLTMAAILSSETSALTRATRRNIPEDGLLHRREINVRCY
jgi:hypothetical protein